jgi:hypothetical protein
MTVLTTKALALAADASAPLLDRLLAARKLVDRGLADKALAALSDRPAPEIRKLVLYAKYVQGLTRSLDLAGTQDGTGRWETLDGSSPDATNEATGVLLWTRPRVRRVALVFSNVDGGFGVLKGWQSIALLHRAFRKLRANVVYLRDASRLLHFGGIAGLAGDYPACLAALKDLLKDRGWSRCYTLGDSAGGYAALRYALDLEARAVLSFSGQTSIDAADAKNRHQELRLVQSELPAYAVDLLPLYRARARRPRVFLCYGALHKGDAAYAQHFAELPGTRLIPFEDFALHSTLLEAIRRRRLRAMLAGLLRS